MKDQTSYIASAGRSDELVKPSGRWHDPLRLMQEEAPGNATRIILWTVCILVLMLIAWSVFGKLDITVTADGKLVPHTLLKIVQPAESGIVRQLLIKEGDSVQAGQLLVRLDATLQRSDKASVASDLAHQRMQERRIQALLAGAPMRPKLGDDPQLFIQVQSQYYAQQKSFLDSLDQERSLLLKVEHEYHSTLQVHSKIEQILPGYLRSAEAYKKLEKEGFFSPIAAADKQREATEKAKDLDAQKSTVEALKAAITAQKKRIDQLYSNDRSQLERELAEIRSRILQLQPNLDKTLYREGLMELRAPQNGIVKDLATTTVGAVVQPGSVVVTLLPQHEPLYADVHIKNDDVGFVKIGQSAQIKLAAYPFQKYGMLKGKVIYISADANETARSPWNPSGDSLENGKDSGFNAAQLTYKARIKLDHQALRSPSGNLLQLTPGMQVVAEIHQGKRTVLEYLLSPLQKVMQESGRER